MFNRRRKAELTRRYGTRAELLGFAGDVQIVLSDALVLECRYVDQEIRAPNNQLPPLEDGLALMTIRSEARRFKYATSTFNIPLPTFPFTD